MTNVELLADLAAEVERGMRRHVDPLTAEALAWKPDAEANSIGVTVWHVARWLDLLTVVVLQNRPPTDEFWHASGWAKTTGYDPLGIGFNGFGAITGYTQAEVAAIPEMSAADLLSYLGEAAGALRAQLLRMSDESLHEPAPGSHQGLLAYAWLKPVLCGCLGHVGEIDALVSMRGRAIAATAA